MLTMIDLELCSTIVPLCQRKMTEIGWFETVESGQLSSNLALVKAEKVQMSSPERCKGGSFLSKPLTCRPSWVIYYPETGILTNHSAQQTQLWQSSAIRLLNKEGLLPDISHAGFMCTLVLSDRFKALCRGAGG